MNNSKLYKDLGLDNYNPNTEENILKSMCSKIEFGQLNVFWNKFSNSFCAEYTSFKHEKLKFRTSEDSIVKALLEMDKALQLIDNP